MRERRLVTAIKMFAKATEEDLHIYKSGHAYSLFGIKEDGVGTEISSDHFFKSVVWPRLYEGVKKEWVFIYFEDGYPKIISRDRATLEEKMNAVPIEQIAINIFEEIEEND